MRPESEERQVRRSCPRDVRAGPPGREDHRSKAPRVTLTPANLQKTGIFEVCGLKCGHRESLDFKGEVWQSSVRSQTSIFGYCNSLQINDLQRVEKWHPGKSGFQRYARVKAGHGRARRYLRLSRTGQDGSECRRAPLAPGARAAVRGPRLPIPLRNRGSGAPPPANGDRDDSTSFAQGFRAISSLP